MCGIAGILSDECGPVADEAVQRMVALMRHRGPDHAGTRTMPVSGGKRLALGSTRLAIIDLSEAANQPMEDPETGNWIVYNGEIYNFPELRRTLEAKGRVFRSRSDTEAVLASYAEWGHLALDRLRGMFAFAIWDEEKQELFLARDRLGVKPLYYSASADGRFVFSSEVRAILGSGLVPRRLDADGLRTYLAYGAVQGPLTIAHGVRLLMPGHHLTVKEGKIRDEEYWVLAAPARRYDGSAEAQVVERVRATLEEATRLRLVSDVSLGAFLSGGIDSSAVVAMMARGVAEGVRTFSVVFEESEYSEACYSRSVAQEFCSEHTELVLREEDMLSSVSDALAAYDQPSVDGLNTYTISKAVREAGITVALSGLGGDELFGGYPSFARVPRAAKLLGMLTCLPSLTRRAIAALGRALLPDTRSSAKATEFLRSSTSLIDTFLLTRRLFLDDELTALAGNEDGWPGCLDGEVKEALATAVEDADPVTAVSILETRTYMENMLLRDTDSMSMAHSLEVRVPLVDHRLVELMAEIPGELRLRAGERKRLLVKALGGTLPGSIVDRPKMGFVLPLERWMRGKLSRMVSERLSSYDVPGIDPNAARGVWADFVSRPARTYWTQPWALYILAEWTARHLR